MTRLICGWCKKEFSQDTSKGEYGFPVLTYSHCCRRLPSSKKEDTGSMVGRKHIHIPYKNGDIA